MNKQEEFERIINKINSCKNVIELDDAEKEMIHFFTRIGLDKSSRLYNKVKSYIDLMRIKVKKGFNLEEGTVVKLKESDFIEIIKRIVKK
jgi:hypothetical protein